jgi:threonine synthase
MKYISTRGQTAPISFMETVMMGLATDKGLLIPSEIPNVKDSIKEWSNLSYTELAFEIMSLFATDVLEDDLKSIIKESYSTFDSAEVTPSVKVGDKYILELFHGPTLAFKDVALQFLGNMFEYILEKKGGELNILGATSGDTGSAAIYGVRGKEKINIFVMHPHKRVSPVQELQMTTVVDDNVHNIAIDGSFDDAQNLVKKNL